MDLLRQDISIKTIQTFMLESTIGDPVGLYEPYQIHQSVIGDYSYVSRNSSISMAKIGKFCSIGPNFICGWGIHPTHGISTAPMFYSASNKSNGMTLSKSNKYPERKPIEIGNDVFIGANVMVLDGVKIGDGAIIAAGAVVSKDIPDYAVAMGVPIKIVKYRYDQEKIEKIKKIKWWDWEEDKLKEVEKYFDDVDAFLAKHY